MITCDFTGSLGVIYFSNSHIRTPEEIPTTYIANFKYLNQALLIDSSIKRFKMPIKDLLNILTIIKQTEIEIMKVTINSVKNIRPPFNSIDLPNDP
jgi:hypothetical protein